MMIRWDRYNLYLLLAAIVICSGACRSTEQSKRKKALSTFRLYLENSPDPLGRSQEIAIDRDNPVKLTVEKAPFLAEARVKDAKVVEVLGGFVLHVQLDHEGALLLQQYTGANLGRHLAVFSQFPGPPEGKLNQGRWLAAPKITNHITDGLLAFTPDMTRDEADQFVLGLNNVARKLQTGQEVKW
jgi:preprotein translocase subunit SecD